MAQTWSPHSMLDSTWKIITCASQGHLLGCVDLGYHGGAQPPGVHHGAVAGVQDGPDLGVGLLVAAHPDGHLTCSHSNYLYYDLHYILIPDLA